MVTRMTASSPRASDVAASSGDANIRHEDHRKRKRNRTSKSCINCRMAKRQCDRQRPACQRCVSLGLTGLCAFEVDETPASSDPLDENARLRRRIAELERVIRELQKKPHPRWAPSASSSESIVTSAEKRPEPNYSEPEAEVTGGITLIQPFPKAESQQPDLSTGESIASSSGASTPVEMPNSWTLHHDRRKPSAVPRMQVNNIQEEWYRASNQPPPSARMPPLASSLIDSPGLGYNDHQFVEHHPHPEDVSMIEYPGIPTRKEEAGPSNNLPPDNGNIVINKPVYRYPQWPTISLGDDQ